MFNRIVIYGAGAMGTVLGTLLRNSGVAVDLVSRNTVHIQALKTKGALVTGMWRITAPPFGSAALLPEEMSGRYDLIFLMTKQLENAKTAAMLERFLSPAGIVCTIQNGFPEPALAEILGADRVLGAVTVWGASPGEPGEAVLTSRNMSFTLGGPAAENSGNVRAITAVKELLEKFCPVTVSSNFAGVRWSKLIINAAFSGPSAMSGLRFGEIAADRLGKACALRIIKECIEVCRAASVKIEPVQGKDIAALMRFDTPLRRLMSSVILPVAVRKHALIKSGMLYDLDRKRPCEIDAINGSVSAWGRKYHVPTPVNDRIVEVVHAIERGERNYCRGNFLLFKEFL